MWAHDLNDLQLKDNSSEIPQRNLRKRAVEILRVKLGSSPRHMKNVLQIAENQYDSRNKTKFKSRTVCTITYGIETTSIVAPVNLSYRIYFCEQILGKK